MKDMNTTVPSFSSAFAEGAEKNEHSIAMQHAAMSRGTIRALSAPVFVVGLEWIVSGTNKIIGNFVGPFPAYASSLQAQRIFLPGLSIAVQFPVLAAWLVIATEIGLGITLVLTSFSFLLGANRVWETVGSIALCVSAVVAAGLWIIVGRPPFWPDGNGYGSGWPVEFFLVSISAALVVAIALADPDGTLFMRAKRLLRRRE
jgi:uncharacterized membrane protein YphA (DoxX/SURF4 family)